MLHSIRPTLVIGESLIDIVQTAITASEAIGGSPANVALGLGRLGAEVRFHTALARDVRGEQIGAHLEASGVTVDPSSWILEHTSTATAEIQPDGSAEYDFRISSLLAAPRLMAERHVHVGSISLFAEPSGATISDFVSRLPKQVSVSVDPNVRPALVGTRQGAVERFEQIAHRADIVKMSDEDAAWLYPGVPASDLMDRLLAGRTTLVAITARAHGASLASPGGATTVTAPRVPVTDTIGAGDTFMAALIASYGGRITAAGLAPDDLADLGSFAANASALTVQRRGADLPDRQDVLQWQD